MPVLKPRATSSGGIVYFPVFVYGSLKKGFINHHIMEKAGGILKEETTSALKMYSLFGLGVFPALAFYKPEEETPFYIHGELYHVPSIRNLALLDSFERGYEREVIELKGDKKAFVYMHRPHRGTLIRPSIDSPDTVSWFLTRPE